MRVFLLAISFLVIASCNWVDTENEPELISEEYADEILAVNQAQTVITHVASIGKIVFATILSEADIHGNFTSEEEIQIRMPWCPISTKKSSIIQQELLATGVSKFDLVFPEVCELNGITLPYEGKLNLELRGDVCAPNGEMIVNILEDFKIMQNEQLSMLFESGNIHYFFKSIDSEGVSFDTEINALEGKESGELNQFAFELSDFEDVITTVRFGDTAPDTEDPISFIDDTAEISFSSGVLERTDELGNARANANLNDSNLIFDIFCGCPIDGRLSLDISITEFITDFSPKTEDCSNSPLTTIISNGNIVIENEPLVDTFLPCDGF